MTCYFLIANVFIASFIYADEVSDLILDASHHALVLYIEVKYFNIAYSIVDTFIMQQKISFDYLQGIASSPVTTIIP